MSRIIIHSFLQKFINKIKAFILADASLRILGNMVILYDSSQMA